MGIPTAILGQLRSLDRTVRRTLEGPLRSVKGRSVHDLVRRGIGRCRHSPNRVAQPKVFDFDMLGSDVHVRAKSVSNAYSLHVHQIDLHLD